jgi:hypothetical protein
LIFKSIEPVALFQPVLTVVFVAVARRTVPLPEEDVNVSVFAQERTKGRDARVAEEPKP